MAKKATKKATPRRTKRKARAQAKARRRRSKPTPTPTPRTANQTGRPTLETEDWKDAFLAAIEEGEHGRDAAALAKVNVKTAYRRRREDEAFKEAWAEAERIGTKALEAEAGRRAYHGTMKPHFYKGFECGLIREYSDALIMFLLRARRPKKYRDNAKFEHVGKDGAVLLGPTIYLPDNGRSKPDAANIGSEAGPAEGAAPRTTP